jgi:hypothetical protein
MKKIFSFIFIALICISLNSCAIYTMCDECDRACYHTHNVYYESTLKRCYYCNYKPDLNIRRNDSNYKPITYRYYTVPIYDPNKPIRPPHIHHYHKHHPKPTPHKHSHRPHNTKHNHNHKHNRR